MQILSHRGFWHTPEEKNSRAAIKRSFKEGFGLETDVRDLLFEGDSQIVVSHDPVASYEDVLTCRELVNIARRHSVDAYAYLEEGGPHQAQFVGDVGEVVAPFVSDKPRRTPAPMAINVKADGLAPQLAQLMSELDFRWTPWFAFDMSGPEMVRYLDLGIPVFTRLSEIEMAPTLYDHAQGVWVDSFMKMPWYDVGVLQRQLDRRKKVCLVSPELHGHSDETRDFVWSMIRNGGLAEAEDFMLCTDFPQHAREFFRGDR
ncbi:hypothetical protein AA14337_3370 [Acetobacter malorum DSM 14337]|uniref:Glycerophosphoryl diester phosphodiesterase n=1 Tax=Acetobacter malorum DSM 14337 TaxID=1307910 RepID=A0ABQ0Q178_9PROT|nr:hypothetical protein [Acetobacter malorum]KXV06516.1 hypothetical protein AD930_07920 [Acetobacter malorum]GBQ86613.1 hypothetical protein AA14337_3370 [Acetobacter malorum DSM 14337]